MSGTTEGIAGQASRDGAGGRAGRAAARPEHRFYTGMALAILATVLVGFARSFYLKPVFPAWPAPPEPIFLVHGLAFTAWVLLLPLQATLVARRRVDLHRTVGAYGAALALAMIVLGVLGALVAATRPGGFVGVPVPPLQFLAVPLFAIAQFALFVVLAIARRRDGQAHKRLMLLASFQMVTPALARWPVVMDYGPPAFFAATDLFLVALAIWDLRTRGRLHPVTLWGGLLMVAAQPIQLVVSGTEPWLTFARWATGLLG
ncbi:MAG: hypothetical protein MUE39_05590 [Gammaproteobacteria bacterium]|jgi:uncharacterized membrane protein YozB (DUF420 family)|nr:hypothetical protein [Gammaproteobacteria bacterium]